MLKQTFNIVVTVHGDSADAIDQKFDEYYAKLKLESTSDIEVIEGTDETEVEEDDEELEEDDDEPHS